MDRFLINKRPASILPTRSSSTLSKKHPPKQGNVSAADRVAGFGRTLFYADMMAINFSAGLAILKSITSGGIQ